jgi:Na+/H+-dicarboxylate symporter
MDMTATNMLGDVTAATFVSASEKLFDGRTSSYRKNKEVAKM